MAGDFISRTAVLLLLFFAVTVFFSSCRYEKRLHAWAVFHAGVWNEDRTAFAFCRGIKLYKAPRGLARFPDGGQSKSLHENLSFYVFHVASGRLTMIEKVEGTKKTALKQFWHINMYWQGDRIFCSIETKAWNRESKKYEKIPMAGFIYDTDKKTKKSLKSGEMPPPASGKRDAVTSGEIKKYTEKVHLRDWGTDPLDYCMLTMKEYTDDLINLRGDQTYRRAITEKMAREMKTEEIKVILSRFRKKMEELRRHDKIKHMTYRYSIEDIDKRLSEAADK